MTMHQVESTDGTLIAFDEQGQGPAVIFVDGAMSTRSGKVDLAKLLAAHFTVYGYDRRGRRDSGDTHPYAVQREIEDIDAMIDQAGGSAYLYGHSSGGFWLSTQPSPWATRSRSSPCTRRPTTTIRTFKRFGASTSRT
jgi:pimeloyl-ACP methyl ester carboxylesterase